MLTVIQAWYIEHGTIFENLFKFCKKKQPKSKISKLEVLGHVTFAFFKFLKAR